MSGGGVSGWRRQCKGEGSPALQGQIWRLPYLEDGWFERGINAINEKCKVARNGWRGGGKLRKP